MNESGPVHNSMLGDGRIVLYRSGRLFAFDPGWRRSESYKYFDGPLDLPSLQAALATFARTYNHVRPHQALGCRTSAAVLAASSNL